MPLHITYIVDIQNIKHLKAILIKALLDLIAGMIHRVFKDNTFPEDKGLKS